MLLTILRLYIKASAAVDTATVMCLNQTDRHGTSSWLLDVMFAHETVAECVVHLLDTHELGVLFATTRGLRRRHTIGTTFYSSCAMCVSRDDATCAAASVLNAMDAAAAALVTHVRLLSVSPRSMRLARRFANTKTIDMLNRSLKPVDPHFETSKFDLCQFKHMRSYFSTSSSHNVVQLMRHCHQLHEFITQRRTTHVAFARREVASSAAAAFCA